MRKTGRIDRIISQTFGFIVGDFPPGVEYFFHAGAFGDGVSMTDVKAGDCLEFDVEEHARGKRAVNLHRSAATGNRWE